MMESLWFQKEVERYKGKQVKCHGAIQTVKEVFWDDPQEKLVFYIEDASSKTSKVYERDIHLLASIPDLKKECLEATDPIQLRYATDAETKKGWVLSPRFLNELRKTAGNRFDPKDIPSIKQIEAVLVTLKLEA